jgi:hypothetical protein
MATQNLIAQSIVFISPDNNIDEITIFSSSIVQSLGTNSVGSDIIKSIQFFENWNGSMWVEHAFLELKCFVSVSFQTTIQANIPNLQSLFPTYQIVTWGYPVTFGH